MVNIKQVTCQSSRSVADKLIKGKISAPNFIFKKAGEFKINGTGINVRRGDTLESIVKKINRRSQNVKAEAVKGKYGVRLLELKSKQPIIQIEDRKYGIVGDLYETGRIKVAGKNSRIEYFGKAEIDYSNYLNNLLSGNIKASLATAAPSPNIIKQEDKDCSQEEDYGYSDEDFITAEEDYGYCDEDFITAEEDEDEYYLSPLDFIEDAYEVTAAKAAANKAIAAADESIAKQVKSEAKLKATLTKANLFVSDTIAKEAVEAVIEEHALDTTDPAYKKDLINLIGNTIHAKDFDTNELNGKKGSLFIQNLTKKLSEYRIMKLSMFKDRFEISVNSRQRIINYINEYVLK